jgi:hypothetical protein
MSAARISSPRTAYEADLPVRCGNTRRESGLEHPGQRGHVSVARGCALMVFALALAALAGCHSAFVLATIDNQSGSDLKLVEVDYPSASFGVETLAARDKYHYRFKIQGSGPVKIQFADNSGKLITSTGPQLEEGQEGKLLITVDASGQVKWSPTLHAAR